MPTEKYLLTEKVIFEIRPAFIILLAYLLSLILGLEKKTNVYRSDG